MNGVRNEEKSKGHRTDISPCEAGEFALLQNIVWGSSKEAKSRPHGTRGRVVTNDGSVYPETGHRAEARRKHG